MSTKLQAEEFYDNFAEKYDSTCQDPSVDTQHVKEVAKIFQKHYPNAQGTVLDIGCGTGLLKDLLTQPLDYTGIDISGNMLHYAAKRGYKTIHKPVEGALANIPDSSYDFVFALSCLLLVENIDQILVDINRIARRAIFMSLDRLPKEYIERFSVAAYDHSRITLSDFCPTPEEDYLIRGWTSPTTGISVQTRIIYIPK